MTVPAVPTSVTPADFKTWAEAVTTDVNAGGGGTTVKVWDGDSYETDTDHQIFVDPTGGHAPATATGGRNQAGDVWIKPPPRELARAVQTAALSGTTTIVDVPGVSITFQITAEMLVDYPAVDVYMIMPWTLALTGNVNGRLFMTDGVNTVVKEALFTIDAAGTYCPPLWIKYRITAAGTYTLKGRIERQTGSGTLSVGWANTPSTYGEIYATQVAT